MRLINKFFSIALSVLSDVLNFLRKIIITLLNSLWEKYLDISLSEKIIFINVIVAFFAIILPAAKFYIFESYFYINNPLAVYMIAIVIIMFSSLYFKGIIKLITRILVNGYYLFWIIYIPLSNGLTKAEPHIICIGYYFNIAAPLVFITASLFSYYINYE